MALISTGLDRDRSQTSPFARLRAYPLSRNELTVWAWLGVASLAIAGLFAILLAASRLPGIERIAHWPLGFFGKALVIHVIFSLVIWLLAVFAMLVSATAADLTDAHSRGAMLGPIGQGLTIASFFCLFGPAFLDSGVSELTNYIPLIRHPAYDLGLVLLALGVLAPVLRLLIALAGARASLSTNEAAMGLACLIYVVAIACFAAAAVQLNQAGLFDTAREYLFWGGGHILQFVYVAMTIVMWTMLARMSIGPAAGDRGVAMICAAFLALASLAGPLAFVVFDAFSVEIHEAFRLLQYALGVPALLFVTMLGAAILSKTRISQWPWRHPAFCTLAVALALYGGGGLMGVMIKGSDTRTPAHYHAMVTAVSVTCMGLMLTWGLAILERRPPSDRIVRLIVLLYGGGQMLASIGLFLAGGYGAPRKTPAGGAQMLDGAIFGMYLNGVGALFAVAGGAMFVIVAFRALMQPGKRTAIAAAHG
ncbi:MAG: cbb3-type cytochrome c oxidase subunit I [Rhodoblastus sp.]